MAGTTPRAPGDLKARGRRLWREVASGRDLEEHQLAVLVQACRVADRCEALATLAADAAALAADDPDMSKAARDLMRDERQASETLAKLLAALRLPDEQGKRAQRRQVRGAYGPRNPGSEPGAMSLVERLRAATDHGEG